MTSVFGTSGTVAAPASCAWSDAFIDARSQPSGAATTDRPMAFTLDVGLATEQMTTACGDVLTVRRD